MKIYNERMLIILDFVVNNNIKNISSSAQFLNSINYPNEYNIYKIKKGTQGFRLEHFAAVHEIYNVDMNFIFDEKHTEMFLQDGKIVSAYHRLLEVVHMIGLEINK